MNHQLKRPDLKWPPCVGTKLFRATPISTSCGAGRGVPVPEHLSHRSCPFRNACIGKLLHSGSGWCSIAPHGRLCSQCASMSCNEPSERHVSVSVARESYQANILFFDL